VNTELKDREMGGKGVQLLPL